MGGHAMTPTLFQKIARLLVGQRLHLMSKTNPRVELRGARQAFLQAGHSEQDQAKLPTICEVANLLQPSVLETVGFINNQQLDQMRKTARDQKLFFALVARIGCLN